MGILKNIGGALQNTINAVVSGVNNLGSGIAQGVVAPLAGSASQIIQSTTPLVKDVLNSTSVSLAAGAAASVFGGSNLTADGIAAITSGSGGGGSASRGSASGGNGTTTPKTGFSKFICMYKLNDQGFFELDADGNKQLDYLKISGFATGLGAIIWGIWKGFKSKKRRY